MNEKLIELYKRFGYEEAPATRELSFAAPTGGADVEEVPPLGPETLEQLKQEIEANPEAILLLARDAWDEDITEEDLLEAIEEVEAALSSPETFLAKMDAATEHENAVAFSVRAVKRENHLLPPDFSFPGMTSEIPIDPTIKKFETRGDAAGWTFFAGPYWLREKVGGIENAPFRWHKDYQSNFIYTLEEPTAESPVEIALFSDFGTGLYHSLYIAKQFEEKKFPYAIHLGDVYYAGRKSEFQKQFEKPLNPILEDTSLFTLNANHEMLSGSKPYFRYIDSRKDAHPDRQQQEGSYFCLKSGRFQIIGIETDYQKRCRFKESRQVKWLEDRLKEGRDEQRINILLSSNEPYEYGKKKFTPLFKKDLARFVRDKKLVDLWFWGNTHYCALFDPTKKTPFIGSCIGHGGYPYTRKKHGKKSPAPVCFLETEPRFPRSTKLRQNRGNNGYCVLRLNADGTVALNYIDWMSKLRCEATLVKSGNQDPLTISGFQEHNREGA